MGRNGRLLKLIVFYSSFYSNKYFCNNSWAFIWGGFVSLIIPVRGHKNTYLITREKELRVISWDGESDNITVVKKIETGSNVNFNDGKCDPTGRMWAGNKLYIIILHIKAYRN